MPVDDLFSKQAQIYARHRPKYPQAWYDYLALISPEKKSAWDCATGNGQAASGLANHFDRVFATDISFQQLMNGELAPNVFYWASVAEHLAVEKHSLDLVTVAQAIHWFDLESFYMEVRRVLKPGGMLAVWGYQLSVIQPEIDQILGDYYLRITAPYWSPKMRLLDDAYQSLNFPFTEIIPQQFSMQVEWDLDSLLGFLNSWSVVSRFIEARGYHPIIEIQGDISRAWGDASQKRTVFWPIFSRIGTVSA